MILQPTTTQKEQPLHSFTPPIPNPLRPTPYQFKFPSTIQGTTSLWYIQVHMRIGITFQIEKVHSIWIINTSAHAQFTKNPKHRGKTLLFKLRRPCPCGTALLMRMRIETIQAVNAIS